MTTTHPTAAAEQMPGRTHARRRAETVDEYPRTHLPAQDELSGAPKGQETRRTLTKVTREDVLRLVGSAAAAISLTAWLFTQLVPFGGSLGFAVIAYLLFVVFYILLISFDEGRVTIADRLAGTLIHTGAALLVLAMVVVVFFTLTEGFEAVRHSNFWTETLAITGPQHPLTMGGMAHAAVGTLIMISFALAICIPLGLLCAVFMAEFPSPFSRIVRTVAEAMTALPSIICGLFIYSTYILIFGFDKSGFAASLAITIMILPIIIRSSDVVLRLVPQTLKEASYAMGSSHWRTIWHVVLPTSKSGLMTAIVLGTARGIGETSPILLVAGYTTFMNTNPFSGPMVSLPLATFTLVKSPEPNQIARGFGAAAVLMVLVFVLFMVARLIGGKGPGVLSPGAMRRVRAASARDLARFENRRETTANQADWPDAPAGRSNSATIFEEGPGL